MSEGGKEESPGFIQGSVRHQWLRPNKAPTQCPQGHGSAYICRESRGLPQPRGWVPLPRLNPASSLLAYLHPLQLERDDPDRLELDRSNHSLKSTSQTHTVQ